MLNFAKGGTFCKIQTFSINDGLIAGNQSIINYTGKVMFILQYILINFLNSRSSEMHGGNLEVKHYHIIVIKVFRHQTTK